MKCERCNQLKDDTHRYKVTKRPGVVVERDLCDSCRELTAAVYKVKLSKEQPAPEVAAASVPEPASPAEAEPTPAAPAPVEEAAEQPAEQAAEPATESEGAE